jgi:Flp pilus assembly protein TadG
MAAMRRLSADQRGASAVEFGLIALILVPLLLNVIDFSFLIWARMQVDYAAAVGGRRRTTCA